ncbi:hypothetical protein [Legionella bozemanae]|uniref:hypothetical protein n=1 Tax=Legionella bozemanae TaxID=447 RepID=UPI00399CD2CB
MDIIELHEAYVACRKNKRATFNALSFEMDYEHELFCLWNEIQSQTYQPGRSIAFVVNKPVKAGNFCGRF